METGWLLEKRRGLAQHIEERIDNDPVNNFAQIPSLTLLSYNTHLWGQTGMVNGETTRLYFEDHQRVDQIADRLSESDPDLIGLQEVFCPEMQGHLITRLREQYPYAVQSPTYDGVEQSIRTVRRIWPRFGEIYARNIQKVVDGFTLSHYYKDSLLTKLIKKAVSEDALLRTIHNAAEKQYLWGAGLLLLSKHPIQAGEFIPHPASADLERFAQKGVLKVTVQKPRMDPVTVLLTHLQEGVTPHALAARRAQLNQVGALVDGSSGNVVVMGDLNVNEGWSDQYHEMAGRLLEAGALDCFRLLNPNQEEFPGYTYRVGSPFERRLLGKVVSFDGEDQRLDYIFARGLQVLWSRVLENEFSGLSDHSPLSVRFA